MSSSSALKRSVRFEIKQWKILTKHFFNRLFRNDLVDFENQMKERLVGILSVLMIFSGLISYVFLGKYEYTADHGESWIEKTIIITFFMLIMGIVSILEWDVIYPDSRDTANLSPLPLRIRTLMSAKYSSLLLFVGLFALSLNLFSSIFFIFLLPRWRSSSFLFFVGHAGVHFVVMFLACFFGFFIYVFLLGSFQVVLGPRLFSRISTYLRAFFLILQILLVLAYFRIIVYGLENIVSPEKLQKGMVGLKPFLDYFPPFWFTDLYETLLGHPHLPVHGQFVRAIIGLAVMIFGFIIAMKLSYGRAIRTGVFKRKSRLQEGMRLLESVFNTILLRNTIQRAVFHFFRKTLKSSIFHKMRLASYIAGGLAFVPFLITLKAVKKGPLLNVNMTMLSIPLILSFALLLGLRTVINVPVALEANWVLRLTEKSNILPYFSGFRKALVMLYLVPLFILLFGIYAVIWDPYTSFLHCLYGLSISVLTMEIFFIRSLKIPFTCSYLPGKEKLQLYWFFYAIAFLAYLKIMSWTELELLRSKSGFIYFYAFVLLAIISVRIYQIVFIYKRNGIQYEEEPEPIVLDFDYKTPSHQKENR